MGVVGGEQSPRRFTYLFEKNIYLNYYQYFTIDKHAFPG